MMKATIDGTEVTIVEVGSNGYLPTIRTEAQEYVCAIDGQAAGEQARQYWLDMLNNETQEFLDMMGPNIVAAWLQNRITAAPFVPYGSIGFGDWLDSVNTFPSGTWSGTGEDVEAETDDDDLLEQLGFDADDMPFIVYPI